MEIAEAYEAGYRDGSINYELEHCPACKNVADLQEALAENAKLRELAIWPGTCYDTGESRIFHCSECGLGLDDVYVDDETLYPPADFPRFCPWCGRKVVSK